MVEKYLEKMRQEIYEEKVSIERAYHKNDLLLKENIQFIYTLENSLDKNYESFSPRNINYENYEKIDALKKEQDEIQKKSEELAEKISKLNTHLAELDHVIKVMKETRKLAVNEENIIEQKENFHKKILETQEMERQRIARELHDSVVQSLTGMVHKIEFCTKLMDMDTVRCKLELHSMSKLVRNIIEDIRQIIYDLHPMSFDDIGLQVTLEREADKLKSTGKICVDYKITGTPGKLSPIISLTILRIVQEACNNTMKYADASHIKILVSYETNAVNLEIEDDGCGFDINEVQKKKVILPDLEYL